MSAIDGTTTLTNCTVSGNTATGSGGSAAGMSNYGTATLTNCTVSGNTALQAGGLQVGNGGTLTLGNTIVAGNTAASVGPDVARRRRLCLLRAQPDRQDRRQQDRSGSAADLTGTSAAPLLPVIAALGNYGGPTQTMALLPGSPAIDAGSNALIPGGVTTDQRGVSRIVNGTVDIGAVESQGYTLTVTGGNSQTTNATTAFSSPLAVSVTANQRE